MKKNEKTVYHIEKIQGKDEAEMNQRCSSEETNIWTHRYMKDEAKG